ncbi:AIPR family protein [Nocardioides sp. NPDC059952]|uniref:AIPR family protein n=1 Tax=Nocardioides sp. NPDC059952 TaxID=3347014 RepID=UPI0036537A9E
MIDSAFDRLVQREVGEIRQNFPNVEDDSSAFAAWFSHMVHNLPIEDAVDLLLKRDEEAENGGIDAILVDEQDGVVYLVRGEHSSPPSTSMRSIIGELQGGVSRMLVPRYAEQIGGDFARLSETVRAAIAGGADVVVQLVTLSATTRDLNYPARAATIEVGDVNLHLDVWDKARLTRKWDEETTVRDLAGVPVKLTTKGGELSVPTAGMEGLGSYRIVVLDGHSLALAARAHGPRLVDLNVRYQLRKSKINDAIAETAADPHKQAHFLALNNGLTVICDEFIQEADGQISLINPQIVNGAQTALTLAEHIGTFGPNEVQILARIMEIDKESKNGASLSRSISEATNRQNPVSSADLKAHDRLQVRIEADMMKLSPPWFYERRRNSFAALSPAEVERYAGAITKEDLGQRYRALRGDPTKAITAKTTIFDSTSLYGEIFDPSIPVEMYILAHQLFGFYHSILGKPNASMRQAIWPDFDETTRAALVRARNQFAAHGTALAYYLLTLRYDDIGPERAISIATDSTTGATQYLPLHKLVVMTIIKWSRTTIATAVKDEESFSIKDAFEESETFVKLREDAKISANFLRAQTLDLLPE